MALDPITITITRSDNAAKSFSGRPTNSEPFGITELIGFEFPEVEVFTQPKGLGDGVFFTGQRLNGRTIEIHLKQNERYPQDFFDAWNGLKAFFNPTMTFRVSVENTTSGSPVERDLNDCRILAADYHMINAGEPNPELIVQMMASDPCFIGAVSDALAFTDDVDLSYTYSGDMTAPVTVELTATTAGGGTVAEVTVNGAVWTVAPYFYVPVDSVLLLDPIAGTITYNGHVEDFVVPSEATAVYENWRLAPGTNANTIKIHQPGAAQFTAKLVYDARYLGI